MQFHNLHNQLKATIYDPGSSSLRYWLILKQIFWPVLMFCWIFVPFIIYTIAWILQIYLEVLHKTDMADLLKNSFDWYDMLVLFWNIFNTAPMLFS